MIKRYQQMHNSEVWRQVTFTQCKIDANSTTNSGGTFVSASAHPALLIAYLSI